MRRFGLIILFASAAHADPTPQEMGADKGGQSSKLDLFAQQYESSQNISVDLCVIRDGANIRLSHGIRFSVRCEILRIEGPATIDGTGDRGADGAPGSDNAIGAWTSTNHCGRDQGHKDWESAGTSDSDRGGDGAPGKDGGAGATVLISYGTLAANSRPVTDLHITVSGGPGGAGGPGGQGRLQICGCHPEHKKRAGSGATGRGGQLGRDGSYKVSLISP